MAIPLSFERFQSIASRVASRLMAPTLTLALAGGNYP